MVNNVIGMVNYVIAARPSLLNFVIADTGNRPNPCNAVRERWRVAEARPQVTAYWSLRRCLPVIAGQATLKDE